MALFIKDTPRCLPAETFRLYLRILAGILPGNTDMHLKNFAMFHTNQGLRLTPSYDQVAATLYNYKTMALAVAGTSNMRIGDLKANHIIRLGEEFQLSTATIKMAVERLSKNKERAQDAIAAANFGSNFLKDQLIKLMEKRWNGTFALIGQTLSEKL